MNLNIHSLFLTHIRKSNAQQQNPTECRSNGHISNKDVN